MCTIAAPALAASIVHIHVRDPQTTKPSMDKALYREVVERTQQFHDELRFERGRGRATYTELEESDADLARHQKWLAAIRVRDYFAAPGGQEAAAAVASCEDALARFESEALSAELDDSTPGGRLRLRAVDADED